MRAWLWALAAVVMGCVLGAAVAIGQLGFSLAALPRAQSPDPRASVEPKSEPSAVGVPKIVVDEEVHDFGTMDNKDEKKHNFVIRNVGDAPLEIKNKGTSCKCAVSDFTTRIIRPGESTKVILTWTAREYFGPFEQKATIGTNDPDRPRVALKVKGRVTAAFRADPPEVVFSEISAGHVARSTVRLFAYRSDELDVRHVSLQNRKTADLFEITPRRLSAEQVAAEKDAQSGWELGIVVKPGLPLGRFRQTILVETNLPKDARLEIPIKGKVTSDISIVGRDWNEDRQVLPLGVLAHGEGAERTLFVVVRGRYGPMIDLEIAEVFPPNLLTAELGEPASINQGIAVRVPLQIRVAKQSGPANYLGSKQSPPGHVLLRTNHPQVPEIKVRISFAVEGG